MRKMLLLSSLLIAVLLPTAIHAEVIRLATTTSTQNSGLLDYLLPHYERESGDRVHVIAVGTGKALRMGGNGDVDLLMVHARAAELEFMANGYGIERMDLMHNKFVIVGPEDDPAGIANAADGIVAFTRIAEAEQPFISRGDDSGTHKRELNIWAKCGIKPAGKWYREVGQGMGMALQIAAELDAYVLTDRGTWIAHSKRSVLKLLFVGGELLRNPYSVITISPKRFPEVNYTGAKRLAQWLTSEPVKSLIDAFRINGEALFYAAH